MKKFIYSFSLMVALSTLFACNNNDAPAIEEKPLPVYSYFRGYLNDEYVNIEQNTVWDDRIFLQKTASMEDTIFLFNWYVKFAEDFNNTEELHHAPMLTIQLAPLRMGQYNITSGITYNGETAIYLGKNGTIKYIPNPKHPFKLYLNGIYKTSPHSDNPCISGTMEGVLYNSLNPNDSIVFHNVEFRRVSNYVIRQYI